MNITEEKTGLGNIKKILVFMRPYHSQVILLVVLTFFLALLAVFPPLITKVLIDRVFTRGDTSVFFLFGFLMVAIGVSSRLFALWQQIRSEEHTSELQSHLNLVCRIIRSKSVV